MLNITNFQRNANQVYNEVSPHASQNGHHLKVSKRRILEKVRSKGAPPGAQLHSSQASKVILKILHGRLQQYVNWEFPDVQTGFRKGKGSGDQIANICQILEKAREFQKSIYFCFIDYAKACDYVDHNKLWKIPRDGSTRPPYPPPEKPGCGLRSNTRTLHETVDWFKIGKGVCQGCIYCQLAYFNGVTKSRTQLSN